MKSPDDSFGGVVAEGNAIDCGQIGVASNQSDAPRLGLTRFRLRPGDALGRRRMCRHHVRPVGRSPSGNRRIQGAPFAERVEEPRRAVRVIAGVGQIPDADLVRLELLLAGKAGDRQFRARLDLLVGPSVLENLGIYTCKQCRRLLEFGPLRGMPGAHMRNLMRHDRCDLGCIVGEGEEAAGHEDVPGGKGESVDDGGIKQSHSEGLGRSVRGELEQDRVQISLGPRRVVFASECLHQPLALGVLRSARRVFGRDGPWVSGRQRFDRRAAGHAKRERARDNQEGDPPPSRLDRN